MNNTALLITEALQNRADNKLAFVDALDLLVNAIQVEEAPEMDNGYPQGMIADYAHYIGCEAKRLGQRNTYRKVAQDSWRPQWDADILLTTDLPASWRKWLKIAHTTRREVRQFKVTLRRERDLDQIGRAIAMIPFWTAKQQPDGTVILNHKHEEKTIAVEFHRNTWRVMVRGDKDQATGKYTWHVHPITNLGGLEIREHDNKFWVTGNTYAYRQELKASGGRYVKNSVFDHQAAWVFTQDPGDLIRHIAANTAYSKYHFLAAMLLGNRVFVDRRDYDELRAYALVQDAYQRETWILAGFDFLEFPTLTYVPTRETELAG